LQAKVSAFDRLVGKITRLCRDHIDGQFPGVTGARGRHNSPGDSAMSIDLNVVRKNSESGEIKGKYKKKLVDYSWDSHDLWINGLRNPDDHPFERVADEILSSIDRILDSGMVVRDCVYHLYDVDGSRLCREQAEFELGMLTVGLVFC
jgi:hypothetical protein